MKAGELPERQGKAQEHGTVAWPRWFSGAKYRVALETTGSIKVARLSSLTMVALICLMT